MYQQHRISEGAGRFLLPGIRAFRANAAGIRTGGICAAVWSCLGCERRWQDVGPRLDGNRI